MIFSLTENSRRSADLPLLSPFPRSSEKVTRGRGWQALRKEANAKAKHLLVEQRRLADAVGRRASACVSVRCAGEERRTETRTVRRKLRDGKDARQGGGAGGAALLGAAEQGAGDGSADGGARLGGLLGRPEQAGPHGSRVGDLHEGAYGQQVHGERQQVG